MWFLLPIEGDAAALQFSEESFQHKRIFLLNDIADGFGSEEMLIPLDHAYQSLYLLFVFLTNLLVAFYFKLKTACLVNPVRPLTPRCPVAKLLENILKLAFCGVHILLLRINNKVIVFGEHRYESGLLLFSIPRQLFKKTKEFVLVYCITFGETSHVNNGVQCNAILF